MSPSDEREVLEPIVLCAGRQRIDGVESSSENDRRRSSPPRTKWVSGCLGRSALSTLALTALFFPPSATLAQCIEVDPKPTGADISGLAASDTEEVAVAAGSVIIRSTDATTWGRVENESDATRFASNYPTGVAFGAATFVRVNFSAQISTSADGVTWTQLIVPGATRLYDVAFGEGTFVASGDPGIVWLSANGVDWNPQSINPPSTWFGRTRYAGGRFFLLGSSASTEDSRSSEDGLQWGPVYLESTGAPSLCPSDVTFANGVYYLIGFNCGGQPAYIWTSTDGTSFQWTGDSYQDSIRAIASNGNNIVAIGSSLLLNKTGPGPWVSTSHNAFSGERPTRVIWTGAEYSVVGTGGLLGRSVDGSAWQSLQTRFTPGRFERGAVATNGRVLALAGPYQGLQAAIVSQDSSTWNVAPTTRTGTWAAAAGGQFFQCQTGGGRLDWSLDGLNWSGATLAGASYLLDVAFGNAKYVALDAGYRAYTSADGHTWSTGVALPISSATASYPERIVFGNGVFVISGAVGTGSDFGKSMLLYSTDGVTWGISKQQCVGADNPFAKFDVVYGNGTFLASEQFSEVGGQPATCFYRSTNGVDWIGGAVLGNGGLTSLAFGNGLFVGSTNSGLIGYSSDSTNFGFVSSGSDVPTKRGAYHAGRWIVPARGTGSGVPSVGRLLKCTLPPTFFSDGFENGTTCAWSAVLGEFGCL